MPKKCRSPRELRQVALGGSHLLLRGPVRADGERYAAHAIGDGFGTTPACGGPRGRNASQAGPQPFRQSVMMLTPISRILYPTGAERVCDSYVMSL